MKTKRVVVKIGSSSLTDSQGFISEQQMATLITQLADLQLHDHIQVILVSSGAVAAGLGRLGWSRGQITVPEKQAAAAVGQGLLIEQYQKQFSAKGIQMAQLLLTRSDIEHRHRFIHIRNTIEPLLQNGIIPIVNENDTVAVDEIRFGDNDTLASLVALVSAADQLILLTDIDGLYDANPKEVPDAQLIAEVHEITDEIKQLAGDAGSEFGTGGMQTKLVAAEIAMQSGIEVVIASSAEPNVLKRVQQGEAIGTRFHAATRYTSRKSWIVYGSRTEGTLIIDEGAVDALLYRSGSLLLAGITHVDGEFHEGAVVAIHSPTGEQIAKGIVNFSKQDLELLLARKKSKQSLRHYHAVVHRDYMAIVRQGEKLR